MGAVDIQRQECPRPEYPRPDFERTDWLNLNGAWEFCFDPDDAGHEKGLQNPGAAGFDRKIVVPYPWESRLSGVEVKDYKGAAWYRREFEISKDWTNKRLFLCFGAVDWEAEVWLDGQRLGSHEGGYTPFEFEITSLVKSGSHHTLVVRAYDETSREQPVGKQVGWYTTTSGIWQTVWVEARGQTLVKNLHVTTDGINGTASLEFETDSAKSFDGEILIHFKDKTVPEEVCLIEVPAGTATHALHFKIPNPHRWEPEDPFLYYFTIEVSDKSGIIDQVKSYFGLRTISAGTWGDNPHPYILLNGRPLYLRATLNQSFHPDAIYAFPDDDTIRNDVEANLKAGFNSMRIHIKVDDPRLYYWCDVLGCVILYDIPSFWSWSPEACRRWESTFEEAFARDRNHPSIITWVLFNETWGFSDPVYDQERQNWVEAMFRKAKALDPTRLVEDNSPCRYDHVVTDLNTWHFYIADMIEAKRHIDDAVRQVYPGSSWNYVKGRVQGKEPFLNSEYGSVGAGSGDQDVSFGFKALTNLLRAHAKIGGYVYTELMDIEWEHNGILNYDRSPKDFGYEGLFPGMTTADLNNPDFIILGEIPVAHFKPGERISVPVSLSHYSHRADTSIVLAHELAWVDEWGRTETTAHTRRTVQWKPYDVTDAGAVDVTLPSVNAVAVLRVWLEDTEGRILSRNFLEMDVFGATTPRVESLAPDRCILRLEPSEYSGSRWEKAAVEDGVFRAEGAGLLKYNIALPSELNIEKMSDVEIHFEASSYAPAQKLDWPARTTEWDYPQTDGRTAPGRLCARVGNQSREVSLADCPSDIQGVLSNANLERWRGYGERFTVRMPLDKEETARLAQSRLLELEFEVPSGSDANGLALYDSRTGRHPLGLNVIIHGNGPLGLPKNYQSVESAARNTVLIRALTLVPTAEILKGLWRMTTSKPEGEWTAVDYIDAGWETRRAGFGAGDPPGAIVRTKWDKSNIWLRRVFETGEDLENSQVMIRSHHAGEMDIYLNSVKVITETGIRESYENTILDGPASRYLIRGRNIIAIHGRKAAEGQSIDAGVQLIPRKK